MNVEIKPNLLKVIAKLYECEFKFLPNLVGLSEKTLRELDKGAPHKLETVHMLERALGEKFADEPEYKVWNTQQEDICAPQEIYQKPEALKLATEHGPSSDLACFALALPPSGLIKAIEERALKSYRDFRSEKKNDPLESERKKAFNNFIFNLLEATKKTGDLTEFNSIWLGSRIAETFEFTISDSLLPLSNKQKECIAALDEAIKQMVIEVRKSSTATSYSLKGELERVASEPRGETVKSLIARLKRLNINVLIYSRLLKTRVFDDTSGTTFLRPEDDQAVGLESEDYLFTYDAGITHLVLAPSHYLRMRCPIKRYEVEPEPETMWACRWEKKGNDYVQVGWASGIGQGSASSPDSSENRTKTSVVRLVSNKTDSEQVRDTNENE